jgi:PAS domain S-box-containing protein
MKSAREIMLSVLHPTRPLPQRGIGGRGIRGRENFAYILVFALTGWGLIRKIDRAKALEGFRRMALAEILAAGLLIILLGGLLLFLWRHIIRRVLNREEEKFRALGDLAPDAIYIIEPPTLRIQRRNRKAAEMDGYSDEEITHMTVTDLHPPEDHPILREIFQNGSGTGGAAPVRALHILRKAGQVVPVEESHTVINAGGEILGISIVRDITERQRTEQELHKRAEAASLAAEQRLADIIEFLPDATFVIDQDKRIIAWNHACEVLTGVKKQAMLGRGDYAYAEPFFGERRPILIDLVDRPVPEVEATYKYVQRKGDIIVAETFIPGWNGGQGAHLWGVASPLFDREGRPCGAIEVVRDVTERRRAEQALRDSEQKYRELVQHANSIILRWTRDGRIIFLNEFGQRFFGYTEAEIIGRHVLGTIVPETESGGRDLHTLMDNVCTNPAAFEQNVNENMRRNGERVWIAWTNKVVPGEQGQVAEILSIGTDITARKQAEEALRAREIQLRLIHDNSYDVMFAIGIEPHDHFRFISVNHKFTEVTGLQEEQVVGKLVQEIIPEPGYGLAVGKYKDAIQTRQPVHWEEISHYPAGRKTGEVVVAPVFDESGKCTQLIGTVHDITERNRAEEALRRNEEQLRLIMENLADLVAVLDLDGHRLYNSPSYRGILGDPDKLMGSSSFEEIHPEDRARVQEAFQDTVRTGTGHRLEYRLMDRNGRPRHIESQGSVIRDAHGQVAQVLVVSRDVTERRQAEEAIRELNASLEQRVAERTAELAVARDRAEMADRTKSAFLATMSHELRTPLNSIIGFTGLLLQGLAGPLNAEQAKQLGMVKESGQHLLALINDVLDISKIEAGQIEIANAPFDLPASMQKVVQTVTPLANRKQLPLIVQIAPGVGQITSDRRRVEQILLNLLSNALKFTERGQVTLSAEMVTGTPHTPRPAVRISVADTGMGIKRENLDKLFYPFRQLDTGLTRQHEGTGLGLAICKRLAERLGGTITVESEWGKGSTFQCVLPIDGERKS